MAYRYEGCQDERLCVTVSRARGAKAKADRLFSLIVRARGECRGCGNQDYSQLQTAHIISRRYSHTRTDLDNAVCACAKCHRHWTDNPWLFGQWLDKEIGREFFDVLFERSLRRTKVDWDAEVIRLTKIWRQLEAAA